ncbi:MAG: diguanylate cyclase [Legionellaceae bacterium]|nr:diguanylate cyclase [Legionellaceae bacterium]
MVSPKKLPKELKPLFKIAQERMSELFREVKFDPAHGSINIDNERYILIRASSLANDFFDCISKSYGAVKKNSATDFTRQILFDFSHAIGQKDAAFYRKKLKLKTPSETFVMGPAHFAYVGWASVEISPESHLDPHDFFLMYKHPFSFESDAWIRAGKKTKTPVCIMNAGYSSGWCEESFQIPLITIEISCKARGDDCCKFIMAPPDKIDAYLEKYGPNNQKASTRRQTLKTPDFVKIREINEELVHSVNELKIIEERFFNITNAANDGIIMMDNQGLIIFWNRAAEVIFGYTEKEVLGENLHQLLAPAKYKPSYEKGLPIFFKTGTGSVINKTIILDALTKDCRTIPIEITISALQSHGQWQAIAIFRDVTQRKEQERLALLNTSIIQTVGQGIMVLNKELDIVDINPAFTSITGYSRSEALGQSPTLLSSGQHDERFYRNMWHALLTNNAWEGEIWNRRKSGDIYPQFLAITIIKDEYGELLHYVGVFSDITQRKEKEYKLNKQAKNDILTNLLNRRSFIDQTNQIIKLSARNKTKAAVIFIDIDYFKTINDQFGHLMGDKLLQHMAIRLKKCTRESDCAARIGGDEFLITMYDIQSLSAVTKAIKKIFEQLTKPYALTNKQLNIAVSMGIAIYPDDAKTTEDLIRRSDEAMYNIKNTTKNNFGFWSATK